jgi:hypothetical protein
VAQSLSALGQRDRSIPQQQYPVGVFDQCLAAQMVLQLLALSASAGGDSNSSIAATRCVADASAVGLLQR